MSYSEEAQKLAYAWEATRTPLESIAEDYIRLRLRIAFLNDLLRVHKIGERHDELS